MACAELRCRREHCVSEFKKNRKNGEDVTIVGVLSEYKKDVKDLLLLNFSCVVIGEVNVTDARKLFKWMRSRFGERVDLSGMWGKGVVPGIMLSIVFLNLRKIEKMVKMLR